MPTPTNARQATPLELNEWERYKTYYSTVFVPTIKRAKTAAEIANQAQAVIDKYKIGGFVFDTKDLARTTELLNRANILGRYLTAVESGKYALRLADGDIDILAPLEMPAAEYETDRYPSGALGVWPIVWVLAVGTILIAGLWLVSNALENDARKMEAENEERLIAANLEMTKQPEDVRRDWAAMLATMKTPAKEVGIFAKLFGSETASQIGGAIGLGLILLIGLMAFSTRSEHE
jgi:hypothetical protein